MNLIGVCVERLVNAMKTIGQVERRKVIKGTNDDEAIPTHRYDETTVYYLITEKSSTGRRSNYSSEIVDGAFEAVFQRNCRPPVQQRLSATDVGTALHRIVLRQCSGNYLRR